MNFKRACATAAIGVALFGLSACRPGSNSEQDIHVEAPLDISKAGHRLTLDFEAKPENTGPNAVYMVNLTFDRPETNDPLDKIMGHPPRVLLPFKVNVVHFVDGKEVPVELVDGSQFIGKIDPSKYPNFIPEDRKSGIYYSFAYEIVGSKGYVCLIRFILKERGRYRATIETVQDQHVFDNVNSVVAVKKEFDFGK